MTAVLIERLTGRSGQRSCEPATARVGGWCAGAAGLLAALATMAVVMSAAAQPAPKPHRIGWLSPAGAAMGAPNLDALRQGLRDQGYQEGRDYVIEARWADGASERLPDLARELVALRVDVICTAGT